LILLPNDEEITTAFSMPGLCSYQLAERRPAPLHPARPPPSLTHISSAPWDQRKPTYSHIIVRPVMWRTDRHTDGGGNICSVRVSHTMTTMTSTLELSGEGISRRPILASSTASVHCYSWH